jgi:hypothetical protein
MIFHIYILSSDPIDWGNLKPPNRMHFLNILFLWSTGWNIIQNVNNTFFLWTLVYNTTQVPSFNIWFRIFTIHYWLYGSKSGSYACPSCRSFCCCNSNDYFSNLFEIWHMLSHDYFQDYFLIKLNITWY